MTTPIPIDDQLTGCDECDTCCVLAIDVDANNLCAIFYWYCNCPGGTLTLESLSLGTWVTVTDFSSVGGTYYPSAINQPVIGGSYRLKCVLASGQTYFSNTVTIASLSRYCFCSLAGAQKRLKLYVEVEIKSFTRASYASARSYLAGTTTRSVELTCDESSMLWSVDEAIDWELTAEFNVLTVSNDLQAYVKLTRLGFGLDASYSQDYDRTGLVQGEDCLGECDNYISFDGSGLSHPSNDVPVTGIFTAWESTGGSGPTFHYASGYSIIIRDIHVEAV